MKEVTWKPVNKYEINMTKNTAAYLDFFIFQEYVAHEVYFGGMAKEWKTFQQQLPVSAPEYP